VSFALPACVRARDRRGAVAAAKRPEPRIARWGTQRYRPFFVNTREAVLRVIDKIMLACPMRPHKKNQHFRLCRAETVGSRV
jgi:hypothetical protein